MTRVEMRAVGLALAAISGGCQAIPEAQNVPLVAFEVNEQGSMPRSLEFPESTRRFVGEDCQLRLYSFIPLGPAPTCERALANGRKELVLVGTVQNVSCTVLQEGWKKCVRAEGRGFE
jgi:hypothetical protein